MEDKSLELLTEAERRFFDEYHRCQNEEEIQVLIERENRLNESRENKEIPHLDMTLEELKEKYGLISHEDVWKGFL